MVTDNLKIVFSFKRNPHSDIKAKNIRCISSSPIFYPIIKSFYMWLSAKGCFVVFSSKFYVQTVFYYMTFEPNDFAEAMRDNSKETYSISTHIHPNKGWETIMLRQLVRRVFGKRSSLFWDNECLPTLDAFHCFGLASIKSDALNNRQKHADKTKITKHVKHNKKCLFSYALFRRKSRSSGQLCYSPMPESRTMSQESANVFTRYCADRGWVKFTTTAKT